MSDVPWVKWFSADFLNGISDLEPNEIAVYSVVLNLIYDNEGPIKDDAIKIGRRCNMRPTSAEKSLASLSSAGKITRENGEISNHRCEKEIKSRQKVSEKSSESANARWKNQDKKPSKINEAPMRTQSVGICETDAIYKPEPDREEEHSSNACAPDETDAAFSEFNAIAVSAGWPKAQKLTPPRKANLRKRISDAGGLDGWKSAIQRGSRSSYLCGSKGWRADFDFFLQAKSFMKLLEGSYDDRTVISAQNHANGSGSAADQVLSIVRRRVAEVNPARWSPSQGDFDLDGNASANDLGGGSPIIDHDGQKARCGVDDSRVSPLFFPSASRAFGGH